MSNLSSYIYYYYYYLKMHTIKDNCILYIKIFRSIWVIIFILIITILTLSSKVPLKGTLF